MDDQNQFFHGQPNQIPMNKVPAVHSAHSISPPQPQPQQPNMYRQSSVQAFVNVMNDYMFGFDYYNRNPESAEQQKRINEEQAIRRRKRDSLGGGEDDEKLERAIADEHRKFNYIPLCSSPVDLLKEGLGSGIHWYFFFVKYLWVMNLILTGLSMMIIIPHINNVPISLDSIMFLNYYESINRQYWFYTSITSIVVLFFGGTIYRIVVSCFEKQSKKKRARGDEDDLEDPFEGLYGVAVEDAIDRIDDMHKTSYSERVGRRIMSILIFLGMLVLQGVINYYAQSLLYRAGDTTTSIVVSFIIMAFNAGAKYIIRYLTKFEKHEFLSDFRRWDCFKTFTFKLINVMVLYFVKRLDITTSTTDCPLNAMSSQFFWIVVLDLTVMNVLQYIGPQILALFYKQGEEESSEARRPYFDLTDEYVEVLYRQYLVGLGSVVLPFLPMMALIGNVLEYWLDKYRLLRLCRRPTPVRATFKGMLVFFFFIMGVATLLGYPNGAVWMWIGSFGLADNPNCKFYQ